MPLQTLKGFRDFLPADLAVRNRVISILTRVFESYGYAPLQTPTLEYAEVLKGKYGEEAEKLMYLFSDPGGREVGLNYDLTVPLARVISQYPTLPKPFKRYQIQSSYRAENTQRGRYRQFTQCDLDCVGTTSPLADAEILAIISDSLTALGLTNFTIRVNSRQILFKLLEQANIPAHLNLTVLQSIDKLDKKSQAEVEAELSAKSLTPDQISALFTALSQSTPDANLTEIMRLASTLGANSLTFSPSLVRGLDYYTGSIFETVVTEPKIGSVTGGGRYDQLLKTLGGPDLPAVGTTIGLDRICDVITELNLWPNLSPTPTQILVTIFSPQLLDSALDIAKSLRATGINTELYPDPTAKLDKQLKYAVDKNIPFLIVVGPEEAQANSLTLKNLTTRTQQTLPIAQLVSSPSAYLS